MVIVDRAKTGTGRIGDRFCFTVIGTMRVAVIVPVVVVGIGIDHGSAVIHSFIDRSGPGNRLQRGTRFIRDLRTIVVVVCNLQGIRVKARVLSPPQDFSGIDFHNRSPDTGCLEGVFRHQKGFFQCFLNLLIKRGINVIAVFCTLGLFLHAGKNIAVLVCLIDAVAVIPFQVGIQIQFGSHPADR